MTCTPRPSARRRLTRKAGTADYDKPLYASGRYGFRTPAEQRKDDPKFDLGVSRKDGVCVPLDYAEAARWYCRIGD